MSQKLKDIRSFSKEELRNFFKENDQPTFRGNQVYDWLWNKSKTSFDEMVNIPKSVRDFLKNNFTLNHIRIEQMQKSKDGTIKNAVELHDGLIVESVLIPTKTRSTACVSSQVGCSLDCTFCATAQLKRMRNLTPDEIYDQVVTLDKQSQKFLNRKLTNIVFMGMGEPLMNYKNVLKAIEKITAPEGLGMASKRITLSTSGVPKMIRKLADDGVKFHLAFSLHSAIDEKRTKIMPFNTMFPLSEIKNALEYWYEKTKKAVTYEYIIWKNVNDTLEDIKALVKFCKYIPCKVNLIEYNATENGDFQKASEKITNEYISYLEQNNITVNVRKSRGKDIDAACGQLANKS